VRFDKDACSIYNDRLNQRHQSLKELLRRVRLVGYMRGAAGLLIPAMLWLAFVPHLVSGWLTFIPVAAFLVLNRHYEDVHVKLSRANRAIEFYERGIARIEGRWMGEGITDARFADSTHLYANDLDIFGKGSLFDLLCTARTRSGQETLANWLCNPESRSEILRRQDAIDELRNNLDLREELAVFGPNRTAIDFDLVPEWALRPSVLHSPLARMAAPLLVAFTLGTIGYWHWLSAGVSLLSVAVTAQTAFALLYRARVSEVISAIHEPAGELRLLQIPLARLERESFSSPKLCELKIALQTAGKSASQQIGSLLGIVEMLEYRRNPTVGMFLPVFLWSTQLAFAAEAWRRRHSEHLQSWMNIAGEFEALCALAGYAFEHPEYPFAEILEGGPCLNGKELCHPLLPRSQFIANSISLGADLQLLMVSGSNMSGKSTLLRTVGVNLVLAQAGAPVCAEQLKCSLLTIGATLRVQDSLQNGRSQFYTEIRRLKEIMSLAETGAPVLFLLDEILHGTNSHDRAIGAEAVVRGLVERNAIGLVTTHDLALAKVADALAPRAANVHFEDHLENGEMIFDYHLRNGVIRKSNALELMRAVGLKI
jgi:hypothetical protein